MKSFERRKFLSNIAMIFSAASIGKINTAFALDHKDLLSKFMGISKVLVGNNELDMELGKKYFEYLIISNKKNKKKILELYSYIQQKIPDSRNDLKEFSKEIIKSWYTGVVKVGNKSRVITYTGSLAWTTLKGIKPQGICGGSFGYWFHKPNVK